MKLTIWERYFLKQFLSVAALFLFCFFTLFVIIDFASHASLFQFQKMSASLYEVAEYYTCEFANHLNLLLPLALLVATIKTLTTLNVTNELTALLVGGLSLRRLLSPFLFIGIAGVMLLYLNSQFILPETMTARKILFEKKKQKSSQSQISTVKQLSLKDNTDIVYHHHESFDKRFVDAYWIRSPAEIYHMKYLHYDEPTPRGYLVEHLVRNEKGQLIISEQIDEKYFDEMHINKKLLRENLTVSEELSLTQTWKRFAQSKGLNNEKASIAVSDFLFKIAMPWLCIFAIIVPAPFCISHSRTLPVFFIYAASLVAFISFYLLMRAFLLLSQRQVITPYIAIGIPFLLFLIIAFWGYRKIR